MADKTWLTQDAYEHLKEELEYRSTTLRNEITKKIDNARQEGDLKENGGYHAARDEQSMNETRIQQLDTLLREAEVGETPADDGVVEPGMMVTAEIAGQKNEFLLATRMAGTGLGVETYSPDAPLGQAIIGAKKGDEVSYYAPNGKEISVKIINAVPFKG
ncbi:transcription elongation factor GreA [Gleimia hominis]|uniref:Transcription elongation factor GreA n=1 Tax=Gleimia hominis TaxID=595468 RepID=A0ABU3IED5_9ACTO|nr:transcription elongation factor GreA [Gleimia hominis]MDT3767842.1 transcription elongation factor GreA [Gleimia hominis]WIK63724.1 transcription elongation factor GreA [Gleimia hominis]